jgi:hypothetical protein
MPHYSFLKGIQHDCNVGITDGRDFLSMPLRWAILHDIHTKFDKDWFSFLKVISGDIHSDSKAIS